MLFRPVSPAMFVFGIFCVEIGHQQSSVAGLTDLAAARADEDMPVFAPARRRRDVILGCQNHFGRACQVFMSLAGDLNADDRKLVVGIRSPLEGLRTKLSAVHGA